MARIILLALALLAGFWAADQLDGANVLDPNGATATGDGAAVLDPDG